MIFFIIVGLVLLISGILIYENARYGDLFEGVMYTLIPIFIGGLVFGLTALIVQESTTEVHRWETIYEADLRAIGTDVTQEGYRYFLAGGYTQGDRSISYIVINENGSSSVESSGSYPNEVFEDETDKPYMQVQRAFTNFWWYAPWDFETRVWDVYQFHVPPGSIVDGYNIDLQAGE